MAIFRSSKSATIESYDTVHGTWRVLATSAARSKIAVAAVNNEAIFAGGIVGSHVSDAVDIFARTYVAPATATPALQPISLATDTSPASWLKSDGEVL
jgi:hypothetical protein